MKCSFAVLSTQKLFRDTIYVNVGMAIRQRLIHICRSSPRLTAHRSSPGKKLRAVRDESLACLSVGLFGVVCVTDRPSKPPLQLGAVQDNLLRMYRLDCGERHDEFPCILNVDHKFRSAVRRHRSNRTELLTAVRNKRLISYFDRLLHDSVLRNFFRLTSTSPRNLDHI